MSRLGAWTLVTLLGCSAAPGPKDSGLAAEDCSAGVGSVALFISSGWCRATSDEAHADLCTASCVSEGPASCTTLRVLRGPRLSGRAPATCFYGDGGALLGASLSGSGACVAGSGPADCPTVSYPSFDALAFCPQASCRDERAQPHTCVDSQPAPCAATWDEQRAAPGFQCPWASGTFAGTCGAVSFTRALDNIGPGTGCYYVDGGLSGWSYQSDTMSCPNVGGVIPASCAATALCDGG